MRVETLVRQRYVQATVFLAKIVSGKDEGPIRTAELSPKTVFAGYWVA